MVKKILCLILSAVLITALAAGCSAKAKEEEKETFDVEGFWKAMDGVWTADNDGTLLFIIFSNEDNELYYTSGLMFSGAVRSGTVSALEANGEDSYKLTVYYKAVPETMMSSAMPELTQEYIMKIYPDDGYFTIDDIFVEGTEAPKYTYTAPTLEEANEKVHY